jgi:branched-chain amino acid transport system substrate-binding protein
MKKLVLALAVLFSMFAVVSCTDVTTTTAPKVLISISVTTTKVTYEIDDTLDKSQFTVIANYDDASTATIAAANFTVSGFNSATAGVKTLTITYLTKTATLPVVVLEAETIDTSVLALQITTMPTKLFYRPGEAFDNTGLVVKAVRANGIIETLDNTDYVVSGYSQYTLGSQTVTLTFETKTITFGIFLNIANQEPVYYTNPKAAGYVQGVTATTITIGNTAVQAGPLAFVGVPFNDAIKAVIEQVNLAGGIAGRTLLWINYDDGFNATNGIAMTETLVETDEVFALVGHFGTGTVGATLDYIRAQGVPMVYAATGINGLYRFQEIDGVVMPVQPIYLTDGRMMAARAIKEALYGTNHDEALPAGAKIGVLYTNDDAGNGITDGVREEALLLGKKGDMVYQQFVGTDPASLSAAVAKMKTNNVTAIIIATNQAPFKAMVGALNDGLVAVPVFTSYVNADATAVNAAVTYGFNIYTNAWVDVLSTEGQASAAAFVAAISAATFLTAEQKTAYYTNAYATAGYIAISIFLEGLRRVGTDPLTWDSYIAAMQDGAIDVPMGGSIDFSYGKRWGIADMSLLLYDNTAKVFVASKPMESLETIEAK